MTLTTYQPEELWTLDPRRMCINRYEPQTQQKICEVQAAQPEYWSYGEWCKVVTGGHSYQGLFWFTSDYHNANGKMQAWVILFQRKTGELLWPLLVAMSAIEEPPHDWTKEGWQTPEMPAWAVEKPLTNLRS